LTKIVPFGPLDRNHTRPGRPVPFRHSEQKLNICSRPNCGRNKHAGQNARKMKRVVPRESVISAEFAADFKKFLPP
jgi:hypothetical protein